MTPQKKSGPNIQTRLEAALLPSVSVSDQFMKLQNQHQKDHGSKLQIKANQLEQLFAHHQLPRNPTRCGQTNTTPSSSYKEKRVADPTSNDSRGKSYDSYMKKRDARLTELWDSNGLHKQSKMKAMHDTLTEIKARLSDNARQRAETLRLFHSPSALKRQEDDGHIISSFGVSRNIQGKMPLPRTPAAAIPRSATKLASASDRQWKQRDNNPLAKSVPNSSDLRKKNTKPYSTATKAAARSQLRNYTRSTSTNEETPSVKEDKSQSLRKSSVTSLETSEGGVLTQSKNMEPKRFLIKNTAKLKASVASEAMSKKEEDEPPGVVKDDFTEEFDKTETEDQVVEGSESRMSHESEKLMDSESEHSNSNTFSQVDHTSVAELPGESPMSCNSRTGYPFSYTQEVSDVESPIRSPASWNLHPTEARMRKKWGFTQKPNLVPSSSDFQSRKDMTKGFKRLLKFGRKSRYTENLDYISATTSEGDHDTKHRRHPTNRSSEDLRKSRMGYSHESDFYGDEVHTLQSSIPTPPAILHLREDHLSGSYIKAPPRSYFSLLRK